NDAHRAKIIVRQVNAASERDAASPNGDERTYYAEPHGVDRLRPTVWNVDGTENQPTHACSQHGVRQNKHDALGDEAAKHKFFSKGLNQDRAERPKRQNRHGAPG